MKISFKLSLCVLLCSCNSQSNINRTEAALKIKQDTTVKSQAVPIEISGLNFLSKEYFVVVGNDTSIYSCFITKNKNSGKLSMHYKYTLGRKTPSSFSSEDTAATVKGNPIMKPYYKSSYSNQIKELKLILKHASKEYDLNKLNFISIDISSVNGLSENILEKYYSEHRETINFRSNQNLANIIAKSQLKTDLTNILYPYSVAINSTSIDELIYDARQDHQKSTKGILDGIVIFSIITTGSRSL